MTQPLHDDTPAEETPPHPLSLRFRGFYPVVIDVETAGFDAERHAVLEISAALLSMDDDGRLFIERMLDYAVEPFTGAEIDPSAIAFHGIDPESDTRGAQPEAIVFRELFREVRHAQKAHDCKRSIIVAHNAHFDHGFVREVIRRHDIKRDPFHPFSSFDTATLAGLAFGQTVLAKACQVAGIEFNGRAAHSSDYDTRKTAELFCTIVNRWQTLGGWPVPDVAPER